MVKAFGGVTLISMHHLKLLLDALLFPVCAVLWDAWQSIIGLTHLDHLELIRMPQGAFNGSFTNRVCSTYNYLQTTLRVAMLNDPSKVLVMLEHLNLTLLLLHILSYRTVRVCTILALVFLALCYALFDLMLNGLVSLMNL